MPTVQELTIEELKVLIAETVEEKLEELLGDPDWKLQLKEDVQERLRQSMEATQRGETGIPIDEVIAKTGLNS